MSTVIAALELLVLERRSDGRFVRRGRAPAWCEELAAPELRGADPFAIEAVFPFLESFLPGAEQAWKGILGGRAFSGLWTETSSRGEEFHLEASAARVGTDEVLVVGRNERLFEEQRALLQRARELRVSHAALMREIEQKDVLLHGIVHELAAALQALLARLLLLGEQSLSDAASEWLKGAVEAAMRQKHLIGEVLEVFSIESEGVPVGFADAPDVASVIEHAVRELEPLARRRLVHLEVVPGVSASRVAGEARRLARVVMNLVESAIRASPSGGRVRVASRLEGAWVWIGVDDEGAPVPIERLPTLFDKLVRGRSADVGTGLGLYFCRITVERWGGGIGYEPTEERGARFWVRLPTVQGASEPGASREPH